MSRVGRFAEDGVRARSGENVNELTSRAVEKFQKRLAVIGVLGLGYVGLPLACLFAEKGFKTIGFDIDGTKVESLRRGKSYIEHIPSDRLASLAASCQLTTSSDFNLLWECDASIICVPTPLGEGRTPDLRYVIGTAREIALRLHRGQLVVLESTTYPGTTDEELLAVLATSGLAVGHDFFLAFSPEREDPANPDFSTERIPKLVGGVTDDCLKVAVSAYAQVVEQVVPVSSARVAEAAKLLENIYRCVNIALINELKLLFERMDLDVWEVITAASTKPFGFTPFYPGPGLGGHCIPIDPFYLTWKARQYDFTTRFIELAGEINSAMPRHVVERLTEALNSQGIAVKGSRILLLGVAYKRDVDDTRESPALSIISELRRRFAIVTYHDPHVRVLRSRHLEGELTSVDLTQEVIANSDAVVIVTDHTGIDYGMVVKYARLVVDTRNVTAPYRTSRDRVVTA